MYEKRQCQSSLYSRGNLDVMVLAHAMFAFMKHQNEFTLFQVVHALWYEHLLSWTMGDDDHVSGVSRRVDPDLTLQA